jgi:hypothetical protein
MDDSTILNQISQDSSNPSYIALNNETDSYEQFYSSENRFIAERLFKKINSERNWFERIIKHNPTVGSFYETLIRNALREIAPINNKISTGFIYDAERNKHGKQIDILVYDDTDRNVIIRSEDFSIVYPGSVLGISEIKKTITTTNIKQVIETTIFNSSGSYSNESYGVQKINIFGFELKGSIESLYNSVQKTLNILIKKLITPEGKYPISTIVLPCIYFLNENFIITTDIVKKEHSEYELKVSLHEKKEFESLGRYIVSMLHQNRQKLTIYESDYMASKVTEMPIKSNCIDETVILYKRVCFSEMVSIFNLSKKDANIRHYPKKCVS